MRTLLRVVPRLRLPALLLAVVLAFGCAPTEKGKSATPRRIIAVAPNIVEILFELGLDEQIVAVGDHSRWPPEVAAKARIGGLLDPRLEAIASLEPDLAVLLPSEQRLATGLQRLGVEVMEVPVESLEDVELAIESIAARTGYQARGAALVDRLRASLAPQPLVNGPRVLLVVGREPDSLADVYAAADGTFLHQLLDRLGGINVVADSPVRYPQVGLEEIAIRHPEVIVELQPEVLDQAVRDRLIADWRRELPIDGVCVAVLEGDHVLVPGPRVGKLYADLMETIADCRVGDE